MNWTDYIPLLDVSNTKPSDWKAMPTTPGPFEPLTACGIAAEALPGDAARTLFAFVERVTELEARCEKLAAVAQTLYVAMSEWSEDLSSTNQEARLALLTEARLALEDK